MARLQEPTPYAYSQQPQGAYKIKKPFYKKVIFWVLIFFVLIIVIPSINAYNSVKNQSKVQDNATTTTAITEDQPEEEV
jgi:cytochrome c biogenesis factor